MPSPAIYAAASAIPGPQQPFVAAAASIFGSLFSSHPKDRSRIQAAQDNLTKALGGDATALAALQAQAIGSATQTGKDAAKAALQAYATRSITFASPQSPLQQVVDDTVTQVRKDIATGVQKVGAGATTELTNRVSGDKSAATIPLSKQQLLIVAAIAAAILFFRR